MKQFLRKNWVLGLILFLAAVLRLYRLGETPPSLTWDETALGYNAYSVLKTARDEYGKFLPLFFKSFGDFKPGLYVYLTVPSVAIFGLNEFAVRLPSAILGVLGVWGVYLLTKALLANSFHLGGVMASAPLQPATIRGVSGLAAFALAISPWHIEFSRGAWEANLTVFLTLAGILSFLKGLEKSRFLTLAAVFFGLSFFSYQGAKVFTPLLILGLIFIFWDSLKALRRRNFILPVFILTIFLLPLLWGISFGKMGGRAKVMSVFSYPRPAAEIQEVLSQDKISKAWFTSKIGPNSWTFKLFHSELLNFGRGILGRYFNHFSGKFLFFEGDWSNKRLGVPYMGVMYFIEALFLPLGVYFLIRQGKRPAQNFIFYWLFISAIPAAVSRDSISAVRSLNMVIPLVIIVALGIWQLTIWFKARNRLLLAVSCWLLAVSCAWNFAYFLDQYFIHAPIHNSSTSQYGYRETIKFIAPIAKNYQKIVFTQKYGQPYIYWLFYTEYEPESYQKQAHLIESPVGDVGRIEKIDNIEFRDIYWPADRGIKNGLFIGTEFELPLGDIKLGQATVLKEINFLKGQLAFRIVETR